VASPLTRALQTSDVVWSDNVIPRNVRRMALPCLTERLYLSSDVGRSSFLLKNDFCHWDFGEVASDTWWYHPSIHENISEWRPKGIYCVAGEPEDVLRRRMEHFRVWLSKREERVIGVVAHWGVFKSLTGHDFRNCEIMTISLNQLMQQPITVHWIGFIFYWLTSFGISSLFFDNTIQFYFLCN
jgi:broad specificity phosphatase PhoE